MEKYQEIFDRSLNNPEEFWAEAASPSAGTRNGMSCWIALIRLFIGGFEVAS